MVAPKGHAPYPGCETGGRPQKYTDDFIDDIADKLELWIKDEKNIFIEFFCVKHDIDDDRVSLWCDKNQKFKSAYAKFKLRQRGMLQQGGLSKKYQYNMCQLLLGHNHGIIPKSEQKIVGDPMIAILDKVQGTSRDLTKDE